MLAIRKRLDVRRDDRGIALVTAMAVAFIGLVLTTVVISASIVAMKDSATDRARTTEVHTAEGAVDAAYAALELGTPCRLPATGTYTNGAAPTTTSVYATVSYLDASGTTLPCASDAVTGTPATAVVTAVSTAGSQGVKRTVQSKVNLTPIIADGHGAAIFSASAVSPTNNFQLRSLDPNNTADLWVDTGNYSCSSNASVSGNVIVVNGSATLSNDGCTVSGDLYTSQDFTVNTLPSPPTTRVGGDVVARGNATIAGGNLFGRNVSIHGSLSTWGSPIVTSGAFRTGVPLAQLPTYASVGLPEVLYRPADFVGFANTGDRNAAYISWVNSNAVTNNAPSWSDARSSTNNQCTLSGDSYDLNGPLVSPSVATVFDTRHCALTTFGPDVTLRLRADLVLYVTAFTGTNSLVVESADGLPHRLWILAPDADGVLNGTATCAPHSGNNITLAADSTFRQSISTFFYTPCTAQISNQVEFYGQIYGKNVVLQNGLHVAYVPVGVPGVNLDGTTPVNGNGYRVDIVYKREIRSS